MLARRLKFLLFLALTLLIICVFVVARTDYTIRQQIAAKSFAAPTEFFASPQKYFVGQIYRLADLKKYFTEQEYRERQFGQLINAGDFASGMGEQCQQAVKLAETPQSCFTFRSKDGQHLYLLIFNEWDAVTQVYEDEDLALVPYATAEAIAFAQYLGDKPALQKQVPLHRIPRYCLDAVMAIEDPNFLHHAGISPRALLRALLANLKRGWGTQGGSTITQQLVKNYFLTPEKTITRKIKEILLSLILEFRVSKDEILENYLNVIYLGQQGVFEIRGYESAAKHYYNKAVSQLDLGECALLAAIVNSPGRYNPIAHPEAAAQRRTRVLSKMLTENMITAEEFDLAERQPLPQQTQKQLAASAPYYIDAVKKSLKAEGIVNLAGLKIFTAFDWRAQTLAQKAVTEMIAIFETQYPAIKKHKEAGHSLQAVLLSSHPLTGEITAIVGGRSFASSPYNRAMDSQRQVGSIFKPIVYLTALENQTPEGGLYDPLTPIENSPLRYKYEKQLWEPRNYDRKFSPPVPMFYALKESMNVPTARLAIAVGLPKIVQKAYDLGIESRLQAFPALSLGAFELKPIEVLKVYSTISQFGNKRNLFIVKKVVDGLGHEIFTHQDQEEQVGDPQNFAVLIGMMKEALVSGTGQAASILGMNHFAAGKTGTTSDTKDAWFAGFTPFHTAVAWLGYDENIEHGLTGASGALPIWANYMGNYSRIHANKDFVWPPGVLARTVSPEELANFGVQPEKIKSTNLIFREPGAQTE